jgi:hypothetical protein
MQLVPVSEHGRLRPWQMRVMTEMDELEDRKRRLDFYIGSPGFDVLPAEEREKLTRQRTAMGEYLQVLKDRIANFTVGASS